MNNPLDELFSLYCMKELKMPPCLHEFPQYPALARGLSRKQRRALLRLFDECTLAHAIYAQDCFRQGFRTALSLVYQLAPQE
ncbi:MAG TPA: hypothetical protein H9835_02760 [Candidatus Agathobaculum merdigallinarum]|nr:hypothetical protein [Candidatus Agathobaculum merdigallinarum]